MFEILVSTAFSNLRFVFFLKTVQAADTSYVLSTAVHYGPTLNFMPSTCSCFQSPQAVTSHNSLSSNHGILYSSYYTEFHGSNVQ